VSEIDSMGQIYANINGGCSYTYKSRADSVTIQQHTCQSDAIPLPYTYKIAAGVFTSTISQEDADQRVKQRLIDSAEISANINGRCYYSNDTTGLLVYPDCATLAMPDGMWVQIPADVDTSMTSKEAANAKARARYRTYAQARANELGTCPPCNVFYSKKPDAGNLGVFNITITDVSNGQIIYSKQFNDPTDVDLAECASLPSGSYSAIISVNGSNLYVTVSGTERLVSPGAGQTWLFVTAGLAITRTFLFSDKPATVTVYKSAAYTGSYRKTDCPAGWYGSWVGFPVAEGAFSSSISPQDADAKAKAYADQNGPANANLHGFCMPEGKNVSIRAKEGESEPGNAYSITIKNNKDSSTVLTLNHLTLDGNMPYYTSLPEEDTYIVEIFAQTPGLNVIVNGEQKTVIGGGGSQTWRVSPLIDIRIWSVE
jgi:hypothetical protein